MAEIFQFVEIFQFQKVFQFPQRSNYSGANPHRRSRHTANSILHHGFWKYSNARKHSNSRNAATAQKQIHAFVPDTRHTVSSTTASANIPVDGKEQVLGRAVKRRERVAADTRGGLVADKPAQDFLLAVLSEHVLEYSSSQHFPLPLLETPNGKQLLHKHGKWNVPLLVLEILLSPQTASPFRPPGISGKPRKAVATNSLGEFVRSRTPGNSTASGNIPLPVGNHFSGESSSAVGRVHHATGRIQTHG